MQEAEEQDTCRICSAPGEPGQPLFYPCKCSGTIRYIHQDCLTTWLAHSKKKTCDVCKHPYSFTKVYASDMPAALPLLLLIRRLIQQIFFGLLFGLRAVLVGTVWLAVLPWITVWTWRVYFTMGESTAWWISGRPRSFSLSHHANTFDNNTTTDDMLVDGSGLISKMMTQSFWRALSADVFAGQIIASLIVLVFVAIFLLREWISQNARPGMFDDNEAVADLMAHQDMAELPQPLAVPEAPAPLRLDRQEVNADVAVPAGRRIEAERLAELRRDRARLMRARRANPYPPRQAAAIWRDSEARKDQDDFTVNQVEQSHGYARGASLTGGADPAQERRIWEAVDKGKGPDISGAQSRSARIRRRFHSASESDIATNIPTIPSDSKSLLPSSYDDGPLTDLSYQSGPSSLKYSSEHDPDDFEFAPRASRARLNRRPGDISDSSVSSVWSSDSEDALDDMPRKVSLPADEASISSSSQSYEMISSQSESLVSLPSVPVTAFGEGEASRNDNSTPIQRPPLPSAISAIAEGSSSSTGPSYLDMTMPLVSPSHVTYRAPEELEAGPSITSSGHSPSPELPAEEVKSAFVQYFREPGSTTEPSAGEPGSPQRDFSADTEDSDEEDSDEEDVVIGVGWEGDAEQEEQDEDEGPNHVHGVQPIPQMPVVPEQAAEPNEDLDGNVEDDMEGAMEAIGLRGPIYGIIQNAVLMIFVLDTAIGFGIWLPFTFGKSAALLFLDPQRCLFILHLPIRAMRLATDPMVDFVTLLLGRYVFPSLLQAFNIALSSLLRTALLLATTTFGQTASDRAFEFVRSMKSWTSQPNILWGSATAQWNSSTSSTESTVLHSLGVIFSYESVFSRYAEHYFATFGKTVRLGIERVQVAWIRLSLGHGTPEKLFAVVLGYVVVALLLALYLNVFTIGNARSAGRAVRNAVKQQLLVVKVAVFIIIELVIFPLGCGIMLDICTVWIFPEATLESRAAFFSQSPITAMFYHWVAGTMFMYQFAILLAGCRKIMRPGAMWFIKDPQDQNFHPIRDILDRPTLTQIRKLLVSALMYSLVVACGVGSVAILVLLCGKSIFPLRWKVREPLFNVPVDLLFLQFVLPYTMRYVRPRKALNQAAVAIWKSLAVQLRLTSYMFGGRHLFEESSSGYKSWFVRRGNLWSRTSALTESDHVFDGSFRRVPANDNIVLPRDMRATADVNENGEPVDDAAKEMIDQQDAEAIKAKRDVKKDYLVVYIPSHFRARVITFIFIIWILLSVSIAVGLAVPVQLGRSIFRLWTSKEIHDGYSFIVGFYSLWTCYLAGKVLDRMDKHRQRRRRDGPKGDFYLFFVKRSLLWFSKISYMIFFLGLVVPCLLAVVVELYLVMPIRLAVNPTVEPNIRIVDMWALGLLYSKIGLRVLRLQRNNRITRGLAVIINSGWTHPDPFPATREVIAPLTVGLLGMILLPAAVIWGLRQYMDMPIDDKFIFLHVYPGIFVAAGFARCFIFTTRFFSSWSQSIRDKEFLVEMRLRNLEPEKEVRNGGSESRGETAS